MATVTVLHTQPHGDNHRGYFYLAFTTDTDWEVAKERFKDKYRTDPDHIFSRDNLLLLGPIPNE